jgi:hypothetical protein
MSHATERSLSTSWMAAVFSLAPSEFVGEATFAGLHVEGHAGRIVCLCDAFYPTSLPVPER